MEGFRSCCVTGHREIPAEKIEYVRRRLREEIEQAIDDGFENFISGFAEGVDLMFAAIVAEIKENRKGIYLEAAIPYSNRIKALAANNDTELLLGACNTVMAHSDRYIPDCFFKRNRYMVEHSERIIAVYDGRGRGGTMQTIRFAYSLEKELRLIDIS